MTIYEREKLAYTVSKTVKTNMMLMVSSHHTSHKVWTDTFIRTIEKATPQVLPKPDEEIVMNMLNTELPRSYHPTGRIISPLAEEEETQI